MSETLGERAERVLKGHTFDYAYPQPWAEEILRKTKMWPRGIVWLYDSIAPLFGRPFPLTMYAWICLSIAGVKVQPLGKPLS